MEIMFSTEDTRNGTIVIAVATKSIIGISNAVLCSTATLRWRSKHQYILADKLFHSYDAAKLAADKKNGITK